MFCCLRFLEVKEVIEFKGVKAKCFALCNQLIIKDVAKGHLPHCGRCPFGVRFVAFRRAKGHELGSSANLLDGNNA